MFFPSTKHIILFVMTVLLSIFSTVVMSYIAMAAAIGPWIETTLVLCSMFIFNFLARYAMLNYTQAVGITTAAGGIGGILATSFAFSMPTLYFISPNIFQSWMQNPLFFITIFSIFALMAGSFGFLIANIFEEYLLEKQQMKFPIGDLIYNTIIAPGQLSRAKELISGFFLTHCALFLYTITKFFDQSITLNNAYRLSVFVLPPIILPVTQLPMYIAIGFITGHVIAIPLLVGFLIKILCLNPLFYFYNHMPQFLIFRNLITESEFTLAFCSGMILFGAIKGFFQLIPTLKNFFDKTLKNKWFLNQESSSIVIPWIQIIFILSVNSLFFFYFEFSLFAQIYLFIFSAICIYQMLIIAGKIGIIPLGRFATFVMIPGMLLFNFDPIQITLVAAFVEIAGGVAGDVLFGRKLARLANIEKEDIRTFQWLGLIVSALCIGIIFWLFIHNLGLGKAAGLPAIKAYNRALLINFKHFDFYVLIIGMLFGSLIQFININPALLLGGILMPPNISLMLVAGGMCSLLLKNKEDYYPILSGVSAANSIWLLLDALVKNT
ncbi:MAG: OPT/YSL family transporter [Candidatus Babeliales bacterium]